MGKSMWSLRENVKMATQTESMCLLLAGALLLFLCAAPGVSFGLSSTPNQDTCIANGQVNAIVTDGTTIYLGGSFTQVGPNTGRGVPLDATTGSPVALYPKVTGKVSAAVPDGSGGWYIGGEFTGVGGVARRYLAHIKSDGTVDADWNPNPDNYVHTLALSGATLYVGGQFTTIGGETRNRLAAVDATTGAVAAWDPDAGGTVRALVLSGATLYAGGSFATMSGGADTRNRLAAFDTTTGALAAWNPNANNTVYALAVIGSAVYIGGTFSNMGGTLRSCLAAVDATTGALDATWNPGNNSSGYVYALAASGSMLYAGGIFTSFKAGTVSRNRLAAFDTSSGAPDTPAAWNPNADGTVWSLTVSGDTVYAGGSFTTMEGGAVTRNRLAAIDATTGLATVWNPDAGGATSPTPAVYALAVSGATVYAGGDFMMFGGTTRNRLAAINAATGALIAWNPDAGGTVHALALNGAVLYAGGEFTTMTGGTVPRNRLAAFDTSSGTPDTPAAWNPGASDTVYTLALSGATLYAGGNFTSFTKDLTTTDRRRLAAFDTSGGTPDIPTVWDPGANGIVYALAASGDMIYAGGVFTSFTKDATVTARNRLAAFDTSSGTPDIPTVWDPNAGGTVRALAASGSTLYAGGSFTTMSGGTVSRNRLAAFNTTTGALTAWDPNAGSTVYALAVSGSRVYAGGMFTTIDGQSTIRMLACIKSDGRVDTEWTPGINGTVWSVAVTADRLYAGGIMSIAGSYYPSPYFVRFDGATLIRLRSFTGGWSGNSIVLKWETGSEIDNAGFHLWRSAAKTGPYVRITKTLIASEGSPYRGAAYTYTDPNRPERIWYYKLQDISNSGKSGYAGPIEVTPGGVELAELHPIYPSNGMLLPEVAPEFQWQGEGFAGYRLQFCASENFKGRVITVPLIAWVKNDRYTPSKFVWSNILRLGKNGAPVYWRVVGKQGRNFIASETFVLK